MIRSHTVYLVAMVLGAIAAMVAGGLAASRETASSPPAAAAESRAPTTRTAERDAEPDAERGPKLYRGFDGYQRRVTTDSAEAQRWFNQGIQLLYGFNHDEAIRSFQQAARIDPSCAMAWWGAAYARGLHINNPQMGEEQSRLADRDARRAIEALDRESAVEQALVRAVRQRYEWPAPKDRKPLDQAYAAAMERVWHQFPDDPDVAALFAESLMNLQPWDLWTRGGEPKGRALEVAAVLQRTLAAHPKHPGANHFYIHAVEASPWPQQALEAAERLGTLVPGSGHLVHMPSHIFVRVGRYADAVESNERAIAADEAYFARAPRPDFYSVYYLHNVHFLAYAAMMDGRRATALAAARKIEQQMPAEFLKQNVTIADGFMPTTLHVMIRFGQWEQVLAEPQPPAWRLFSRGHWHYARTVALAALGRVREARAELTRLEQSITPLTDEWKIGNNPAREVMAVARAMAAGEVAFRSGDEKTAFALLHQAASQEDALHYDEPPGWLQPVRHSLGALLRAAGRSAEAEAVYRADLVRNPHNAWGLLGLQQSLADQGKQREAAALAGEVERAWARADVRPPASCYCHPDAPRVNAPGNRRSGDDRPAPSDTKKD
jgi:tetratricopeptide (TPR) repeat protein